MENFESVICEEFVNTVNKMIDEKEKAEQK